MEQSVTVPTAAPVLSYWIWIESGESGCTYDFGGVIINSSQVIDAFGLCATANTSGWVQRTVSLAAFAGQNVSLQIRAETDASILSNLLVDDVGFTASSGNARSHEPLPATNQGHASADWMVKEMPSRGPAHVAPVQRLWPSSPR